MAKAVKKKSAASHATADAEVRSPKHLKFDCMTFTQGKHKLTLFLCRAKTLWTVAKINQRTEDQKGYQRAVSPSRAARIASFIDSGNVIPNSVLISFDHARLSTDGKVLTIDNRPDAGWVIDGQHRLRGGVDSKSDIMLPVVAFVDLPIADQVKCFITINKEHKGVSSSLYLDLLRELPGTKNEGDAAKERAVDLANILKIDEESPFFNRIVTVTSPRKGEISMTNFVRKVAPMLRVGSGRLHIYSDEERCGILNNYYKGLEHVFPKEFRNADSIFFKTLGFGALMNALPTFIDITLQLRGGNFTVSDTATVFNKIDYFDFANWHRMGGGNAGEISAADDLRTEFKTALESAPQGKIKL